MALEVVGAGLGRTGTNSLKLALEQLLERPCYHMLETFGRPQDTAIWHRALRGEPVDWDSLLAGYVATTDWPACAFWRPLADANPDAVVLLSSRESPEEWWDSVERTILKSSAQPVPPEDRDHTARRAMVVEMFSRFDPAWPDPRSAMAAYDAHNAAVRAEVRADSLVDWKPGEGWEPICTALDLPIPDQPFPHANAAAEFRVAHGLE